MSEVSDWQQHQKHDSEYVQSIIGSARVRIKSRLQRRMGKVQSYALEALQKIGITDIPDWTASVSGSGVCCGGSLPVELQDCFGAGVLLSELSDDKQRAMVSLDILALTRFVIGAVNPEPWMMFDLSSVLSEAIYALNDPDRRKEYISQRHSQYGRLKEGSTGPLKQTLQEIDSYADFLAMMNDADTLLDFNEIDPPHPCCFREIEDGKLNYIIRKSGKDKSVTLGRVANNFRELNR